MNADGTPRFVARHTSTIAVEYPESERAVHAAARRVHRTCAEPRTARRTGRKAVDLVTLLLKKRLFSCPAAFAHTVGVYLETLERRSGRPVPPQRDEDDEWLDEFRDDAELVDDETLLQTEDDALDRAIPLQSDAPLTGADRGDRRCCAAWRSGRSPTRPGPTRRPAS